MESSEFVRTANYAIVYARLIVDGRDLGIHNFMVQIRDLQTHQPMPGVEVGDIGPKIGYNNQELRHGSMPHTISDFLRFRFPCPMGTYGDMAVPRTMAFAVSIVFGFHGHTWPCVMSPCIPMDVTKQMQVGEQHLPQQPVRKSRYKWHKLYLKQGFA